MTIFGFVPPKPKEKRVLRSLPKRVALQKAQAAEKKPLMVKDSEGRWKMQRNPISELYWDRLPDSLKLNPDE